MKREILFRGKTITGEWIQGSLIVFGDRTFIYPTNGSQEDYHFYGYEVIPETVGQFTGFIDKNGSKVFDGDIVIAYCSPIGCGKNKIKNRKCEIAYIDLLHGWGVVILDHKGEKSLTSHMTYGRNGSALEVVCNKHELKSSELLESAY